MKLILKEAPYDTIETSNTELEVNPALELPIKSEESQLEFEPTNEKLAAFIDSDELNELRDLIAEMEVDNEIEIVPMLLLLNNNLVVIAQEGNKDQEDENSTFLYCLGEDDNEFSLIPLPSSIDMITSSPSIIQYSPANISDVHDKVVQLFMKRVNKEEEVLEQDTNNSLFGIENKEQQEEIIPDEEIDINDEELDIQTDTSEEEDEDE